VYGFFYLLLAIRPKSCGGSAHLSQDTILPMEHRRFLTTTIIATTIIFLFTAPELRGQGHTKGRLVGASAAELKPGDYVWHPEVSPAGPVVVLVSLPDQILYLCLSQRCPYRGFDRKQRESR
jgi:hypothetical protein